MADKRSPPPTDNERSVSIQLATLSGALIVGGFFGVIAPASELWGWSLFWIALFGLLAIALLVLSSIVGLGAVASSQTELSGKDPFNTQSQLLLFGLLSLLVATCWLLVASSSRNEAQLLRNEESSTALTEMKHNIAELSKQQADLKADLERLRVDLDRLSGQVAEVQRRHTQKSDSTEAGITADGADEK